MTTEPETQLIADLARGLGGTFLEGELILGGSSGLFGFETETPAFTEYVDFLIQEELVAARGAEIIEHLARFGFQRAPESPTFTAPGKPMFDLVGYSKSDFSDHLSRPGPLQVMVYGDLGIVLGIPSSVVKRPSGAVLLSPAAFCAVKLLTLRVEKGAKDKLQALLVLGERSEDTGLRQHIQEIFARFDRDRIEDAVADAQAAFLSLQRDPEFRDRGAEGYAKFLERAAKGFEVLQRIQGG